MRDDGLRSACFAELQRLTARFGPSIPYRGGLDAGFRYRGRRIPFLSPQKGIFRAREQEGPAALSLNTSVRSPYADRETADGYVYSYRAGPIDQPDNRALEAAYELQAPIVYFVGVRPGHYEPSFPWFVDAVDRVEREVHITPGSIIDVGASPEAVQLADEVERRYAFGTVKRRLHQGRFRGAVLPVADSEERGEPVVSNGLSLCSIHHRAFDEDLVGVSPDLRVHVSPRLLDDEDGPMLELLKGFHRQAIHVPERRAWRPDAERLAVRFEHFQASA
jgi:putative restriction endonuclease